MSHNDFWELHSNNIFRSSRRHHHYLVHNIKHILSLCKGLVPGLVPADDESVAPIELLKRLYLEDYKLSEYSPIIMHPQHLSPDLGKKTVYYSLPLANPVEPGAQKSSYTSFINELRDYKDVLNNLDSHNKFADNSNIKFEYFHVEGDDRCGIRLTK